MIGMSFTSFMGLLCISVAVALVLHYLVRYRVVEGFDGFLGKVIVSWIGSLAGIACARSLAGESNLRGYLPNPCLFRLPRLGVQRGSLF